MSEPSNSVFKFRFDSASVADKEKLNYVTLIETFSELHKKTVFWLYLPFTIVYCISFVLIPSAIGDVLDVCVSVLTAILLNNNNSFENILLNAALKVIIIVLINCFASVLQGVISANTVTHYSDDLRKKCFTKLNRLPVSFTDVYSHASILDCVTEKIDTLDQSINLILVKSLTSVIMVPIIIIRICFVDLESAYICSFFITITLFLKILIDKLSRKKSADRIKKESLVLHNSEKLCSNLLYFRNNGITKRTVDFISLNSDRKPAALARFTSCLSTCICELGTGLCIVFVFYNLTRNQSYISIGLIISLMLYVRKLFQPVSQASTFSGVLHNASVSATSINEFLDENEEYTHGYDDVPTGDIMFNNITFSYPAGAGYVLRNKSFIIPSHGITVLKGKTGSGKSTIIKLIMRFYYPQSGNITVGGTDINLFSLDGYRKKFSVITQEASLSYGTILENLLLGTECNDINRVINICKLTSADKYISELKDGYNTFVNPDSLPSGVNQLVLLSRALIKDPSYIIFDEATSFVDLESEIRIKKILKKLSEKCSVIVISHKSSELSESDNIIDVSI